MCSKVITKHPHTLNASLHYLVKYYMSVVAKWSPISPIAEL